jgi:hypothetical protein
MVGEMVVAQLVVLNLVLLAMAVVFGMVCISFCIGYILYYLCRPKDWWSGR